MGCVQSTNQSYKPKNNMIANSSSIFNNEPQQYQKQNINTSNHEQSTYDVNNKYSLNQNQALLSALQYFQCESKDQKKQESKKFISSLNRYYSNNKTKGLIKQSKNMLKEDFQMALKTLKKHHFFKQIFQFQDKSYIKRLLLTIKKRIFYYKQYVYKQFDPSSKFYIIGQGKLTVQLHSLNIKMLTHGEFFGLQSIIYNSKQIQSIKIRTPKAILYQVDSSQILKIRQQISKLNKQQMKKLLEQKVIFFNFLNNKQKQKLMAQTIKCSYSKGDLIFQKDYQSTSFYVIKQGAVLIKVPLKQNIVLTNGSFGQSAFYEHKSQRKGSAISYENNTIIYAIHSRSIFESLGDKLDCAVLHNLQKWAMYRDPFINDLYLAHKFQMNHLLSIFQIKKGQKYEPLEFKNRPALKVFVNLTCKINYQNDITVINSKTVKHYIDNYFENKIKQMKRKRIIKKYQKSKDNFFKLNQLQQQWAQLNTITSEQTQQPLYQNDIVLTTKGTYAQASVQKIVELIINSIQRPGQSKQIHKKIDLSIRNIKSYLVLNEKKQRSTYLAIQKNFGIQHVLKIYHKQFIMSNYHCKLKTFKTFGSLKTKITDEQQRKQRQKKQQKIQIILHEPRQYKQQIQQQQERQFFSHNIRQANQHIKIISNLIHPNICGFYKAQQDNENVYIILQYIKGITLLELQIQLGIVPQIVIKYYLLKLSILLDYIHSEKVVYRDLKPQNILIDNKGYPNLFDFKTAKKLKSTHNFKTSTIIGTPHYMAPEIIQNQQYSFNVDYWQLGIILYELIYQKYPFANDSQDPVQIFTAIIKNQPKFKKKNSNLILTNLLSKNTQNRISNFNQLIQQQYFQNFEWEQVYNDIMKPPFIPKSTSKRFTNMPFYTNSSIHQ